MKELVMKKIDEKIRLYLKKNFPGKKISKAVFLNDTKVEVYGFNNIKVNVLEMGSVIHYQYIPKNK